MSDLSKRTRKGLKSMKKRPKVSLKDAPSAEVSKTFTTEQKTKELAKKAGASLVHIRPMGRRK